MNNAHPEASLRTKGTMHTGTSAPWTHRTFSFVMGHAQLQLPMQLLQQRHNEERSEMLRLWRAGAWGKETFDDGVAFECKKARMARAKSRQELSAALHAASI